MQIGSYARGYRDILVSRLAAGSIVGIRLSVFFLFTGKEVAAFASTIADVIEDVQERLLYRAEVYIRENVVNYKYTEDDFNYPAVLLPEPHLANGDNKDDVVSTPESTATIPTNSPSSPTSADDNQIPQTPHGEKSRVVVLQASKGSTFSRTASGSSTASSLYKRASVASIPTLPHRKSPSKRHTWCPVLEKSLLCLSKMYRCVEVRVYAVLRYTCM